MNIGESLRPTEAASAKKILENGLNFGEFSQMPEYVEVNRNLVKTFLSKLPRRFIHVDVAAGTGMVEKLIKEESEVAGKTGIIIGVDPNSTSLAIARENVISSQSVSIKFIEGIGQNLKQLLKDEISEEGVDSTSILDALHEIRDNEDKVKVIQSMTDNLKPNGFLSFNSAFTTISNNEAQSKWGRWKLIAMKRLGIRERNENADAMPILAPQVYKDMIEKAGLVVIHEKNTSVFLTKGALKAIARYPAFFRGTFDDIRGQEKISDIDKSNALVEAMEELGFPGLPKIWYEIIAQKPCAATAL
ncbi:MAG: class I SAM-dependent methyltransferase [Candidatus Levybacteria bacterium]|nr:class I SAM-dependent methyltransferase [Candidatus Levybacteria bacterium]